MTKTLQKQDYDDVLRAVADSQRRKLLCDLMDHDPHDSTSVSIIDSDNNADAVSQIVAMRHRHLPLLESYGFINWDRDHFDVMEGPNFDQVEHLLEMIQG